uniref:Serine/threonine kinase-like protein n=1 Tax=Karlodinium veneficum TaxID=407301 RepID=A7YXW4_KARVE|nr:serine/threonine kinase-like protein [Karlodinium veneficum]
MEASWDNVGSLQLPTEIAPLVFRFVSPLIFIHRVASTCRQFSFEWYLRSLFRAAYCVPDDVSTINAAINRLGMAGASSRQGIVLVRPGKYSESVRVTQNCYILGMGRRGQVIIEAPGWESALVSAGLGSRNVPEEFGWKDYASGEDASIENLAFRCRNENMRGRCVYIVNGQLNILRCNIDGTVVVSGCRTAPRFVGCEIRGSRGSGAYLTDHCKPHLHSSLITKHRGNGVLVDRLSHPQIAANSILCNGCCGIRIFSGGSPTLEQVRGNSFRDNGDQDLSVTPRLVDSDDEGWHVDEQCCGA